MTTRIRMKFTKTGRIRFLSHLDFMTLFHRAAVRAGMPLAFSQGFNPHPKIAFGPALPVGMESEAEFLDLETDPFADLLQITKGLNNALPDGVRILESRVIPKKAPSLSGSISRYTYTVIVAAPYRDGIEERVQEFLSRTSVIVSKKGSRRTSARALSRSPRVRRSSLHAGRSQPDQAAPAGRDRAPVRHRA